MNGFFKGTKNKKTALIFTLIYLILCLIIDFNRVPFWDEARAWLVSQNCNFIEYLDLMKLECHMFIWYLIIFPFAKLNLFYPYSMQIINTLICTLAIYVLWKKAPFSGLEKVLITFSAPFLFLWGVVARCYAVGILFIFLALIHHKIRFKKPFRYLIFLCLAMNTSVMAFIGAFYLSILFLIENFNSIKMKVKKENFKKLLVIFVLNILIVMIQVFNFNADFLKQTPEMAFLRDFLSYILTPVFFIPQYPLQSILMSILRTLADISALAFIIFTYKNNKKALVFILCSYFSMTVLFTLFYSGNFWHYFYFYFYFIVAFWILRIENKISEFLNILFVSILFCFIFKGSLFIDSKMTTINNSTSKEIALEILSNPIYKNAKLFCLDPWSDIAPAALPYLKNKVKIYDIFNQDRFSYKSMRSHIRFNNELINPDEFYKYAEDTSILLTTTAFTRHEEKNPLRKFDSETGIIDFRGKNYIVSFVPLESNEKICLWSYIIKVQKLNSTDISKN